MSLTQPYLMENLEEVIRLEIKTDPDAVRRQAYWCGLKPGFRVLDAGCGTGKVTSILYEMVQPGGTALGLDYSQDRIHYAKRRYGNPVGLDFQLHDLTEPLQGIGQFEAIWVRFLLEYYRTESPEIIKNLDAVLKPGGVLCLLDLDHNCLNHYELPEAIEALIFKVMAQLEKDHNFDPYSGRKLYSYLYDLGYQDIQLDLVAHHLMYGDVGKEDMFNWLKKAQVAAVKARELFEQYPGGHEAFLRDFTDFFKDPRRFTYTPLIMCKGTKPPTLR